MPGVWTRPQGSVKAGRRPGKTRTTVRNCGAGLDSQRDRDRARDEEIREACSIHEPEAFDRFVERFGNRIYAFGVRMCGHREDAEDVFQETLVAVYQKIETLREPGALTTWLYRIVANSCLSRRRKSKFAPDRELSLEELLPQGGVVERARRSRRLRPLQRPLPPGTFRGAGGRRA